jgi:hypothetical protein
MSNIIWEDPPLEKYSKAETHECRVEEETCDKCGNTAFQLSCVCGWKDSAAIESLARKKWVKHVNDVKTWIRNHPR